MNEVQMRRRTRVWAATALALLIAASATATASAAAPFSLHRWIGPNSSATAASLGTGSCDVNGDGLDDALVNTWFWDKPTPAGPINNVGGAFVVFGKRAIAGGDFVPPASSGAVRIDGPPIANSFAGFVVACIGDVNGDGFEEVAIDNFGEEKAYVVFGAAEFGPVDLGALGDRGFEVHGDPDQAFNVGTVLAPVGDLDDDGLDDYAVGGIVADTLGRNNNGRIWIVAGTENPGEVDLGDPAPGQVLMTIDGADSEDRLGQVAPAGDVNGDGTDDLVLGAFTATPWGPTVAVPGAAWVLWGGESGNVDLATVGDRGFAIFGPQRQRDRLGVSVAAAGDVDGDGLDDVLIGGDGVNNAATGQRPGSAWLIHGADSGQTVYTSADPAAPAAVYTCASDDGTGVCQPGETQPRGYWIQGADSDPGTASESTGFSLAGIGDVSGDGVPDFAVGAYGYDPVDPADATKTLSGAGAVWILHGRAGTATQDLATLTPAEGKRIDGLVAGDRFGRQVAALGDLDDNGVADFGIGADFAKRPLGAETPRTQAGEFTLVLVGPLNTEVTLVDEGPETLEEGETVDLSASVELLPEPGGPVEEGTVAFTRDGTPIAGCEAVPLAAGTGEAACPEAVLPEAGEVAVRAVYSGTESRRGASSDPVVHRVTAGPLPPGEDPPVGDPPGNPPTTLPGTRVPQPGEVFSALRGGAGLRVGANGRVNVAQVGCPAATPCALAASAGKLRIGKRGYGVRISAPATIAAGTVATVALQLSENARKALAKAASRRSVALTLVLSAGEAQVSSTLTLYLSVRK
jgi:FG-GAP repeat